MRIAPTVVPARRTAGGHAGLPDRIRDRHSLFGIAEEDVVGFAEAVINSLDNYWNC